MQWPSWLPPRPRFSLEIGGLLLMTFSNKLPDELQTVGLYMGYILIVFGLLDCLWHIISSIRKGKIKMTPLLLIHVGYATGIITIICISAGYVWQHYCPVKSTCSVVFKPPIANTPQFNSFNYSSEPTGYVVKKALATITLENYNLYSEEPVKGNGVTALMQQDENGYQNIKFVFDQRNGPYRIITSNKDSSSKEEFTYNVIDNSESFLLIQVEGFINDGVTFNFSKLEDY
jgi:hypothetical protein